MRKEDFINWTQIIRKNPNYRWIRNLLLFFSLVPILYIVLRLWQDVLFYWPLTNLVKSYSITISQNLTLISSWIIHSLFNLEIKVLGTQIDFKNGSSMIIGENCSGLKQTLLFIIILIIIPGPWKKKIWFIPIGIALLHFTNILRVTFSGLTLSIDPNWFRFVHDKFFKVVYFTVIFLLWLWWVEYINVKKPPTARRSLS